LGLPEDATREDGEPVRYNLRMKKKTLPTDPVGDEVFHCLAVAYPAPVDLAAALGVDRETVNHAVRRLRRHLPKGHVVVATKSGSYAYRIEKSEDDFDWTLLH
jgi:biotin operon repressor